MSERVESLAKRFEQANNKLIAAAERYTADGWHATAADDERSVGTVAHHLATSYGVQCDLIQGIASGETVPAVTWEMVHQMNAEHAEEHDYPGREETLALLRENGRAMSGLIRGLGDEQLRRTADLPFLGEQPVTTQQFIEQAVIDHIELHLNSMEAAAGREGEAAAATMRAS